MGELFHQGGPHQIKRVGADQYSFSVEIPPDNDGRIARECPNPACSPGYFKIKGGTGLANQKEAYCPYCRLIESPGNFMSSEQKRYAMDILKEQAALAMQDTLKNAFGLGSANKKRLVDGFVTLDVEFKAGHVTPPRRPLEDILKRDLVCPHCGLDHSVFGFGFWCPDCGQDIFSTHVGNEIGVVMAMLSDVERRAEALGPRVAASDLENALEDLVSIFEATLKIEVREFLKARGVGAEDADKTLSGIGSQFQGIAKAVVLVPANCEGITLFASDAMVEARLNGVFQKRHPITHNLGVIDRQYLRRVRSAGEEGTEVRITKTEIETAAKEVQDTLGSLHLRLKAKLAG